MRCERVTSIRGDHPSLAGHFPGRPVVPGVVLLQEVLDVVRGVLPAESMVRSSRVWGMPRTLHPAIRRDGACVPPAWTSPDPSAS